MVKKIPLTQGYVALIDDEDYRRVAKSSWRILKSGDRLYALHDISIKGEKIAKKETAELMHRFILNAKKGSIIDHIDGNGLNNQKENLRFVSNRQNAQNRHRGIKSSKFPGVCFHKKNKNWVSHIMVDGKIRHLGSFSDEKEAAKAYEKACREIVGEELVCKMGASK
jgi:hypothetical protein